MELKVWIRSCPLALKERTTDVFSPNDSFSRSEQLSSLNSLVHNDTIISKEFIAVKWSQCSSLTLWNLCYYLWGLPTAVCSFLNIVFCSSLRAPVLVTYKAQEKYCCWTKPHLCFFLYYFWVGLNTKWTRAMLVGCYPNTKMIF